LGENFLFISGAREGFPVSMARRDILVIAFCTLAIVLQLDIT